MLRSLIAGIRALLRPSQRNAQIEEELSSFFESSVEHKIRRGMSSEEAQRIARIEIGSHEMVRNKVWSVGWESWVDSFVRNLRFATRQLKKSPGFTATAVLTLALGIGANTAVFTLVHAILLGQLPFRDPERVFSVDGADAAGLGYNFGSKDFSAAFDYAAQSVKTIEAAAFYSTSGVNVDIPGGVAVRRVATETSAQFLRVLGVTPELGRGFLPQEDLPGEDHVVLISDRFWRGELAGDPAVLGRTLMIDGFDFRIAGVLPPAMNFPANTDFWTSTIFDEHRSLREAGAFYTSLVVRGRKSVSAAAVQSELLARATALAHGKLSQQDRPVVTPIEAELTRSIRSSLLTLAGAVLLVLLIACANLACLMLVRVARRRSDLAVRAALGAGQGRLVLEQMVECILVAVAGGAVGIALAYGALHGMLALRPAAFENFQRPALDLAALAFTAFASVATGLVFGLAPAWHASREDPVEAMKTGGGRGSLHSSRLRKALVAGEVTVALVLLTGAALLVRTLMNLDSVPLGYRLQGLLTFSVSPDSAPYVKNQETTQALLDFYNQVLRRLRAVPGVRAAGAVSSVPLSNRADMLLPVSAKPMGGSATLTMENKGDTMGASPRFASDGYFRTMGIPLIAGRDFSPEDTHTSTKVVIVSKDLAENLWPGENPVGRMLYTWLYKPGAVVIGEVAAMHPYGPRGRIAPEYYMSYAQQEWPYITFVLRAEGNPKGLIAAARHAVATVDPTQPVYDIRTMQQRLDENESLVRFEMLVLGVFAGVAVALVGIGLYGVVAYAVTGRTHEIGVRLALGAQRGAIVGAIFREGVFLALIGTAAGLGCSLGLMRVLSASLFGVTAHDPLTLAAACALVLGVGAVASYLPARRAAGVDPMAALRSE